MNKPVCKIVGFDEFGPLLEWSAHWSTFPIGTALAALATYAAAQGEDVSEVGVYHCARGCKEFCAAREKPCVGKKALAAYAAQQSAPSERAQQSELASILARLEAVPVAWPSAADIADEIDALLPMSHGDSTRAAIEEWWRHLVKRKLSKIAPPAAQSATVEEWERELSAVMPLDFKDWWQNDRHEWPAVAAAVIRSQRADCELGWKMAAEAAPSAEPLTDEQIAEGRYRMWADELEDAPEPWAFLKGARWAERYYGIGGATTGEQQR